MDMDGEFAREQYKHDDETTNEWLARLAQGPALSGDALARLVLSQREYDTFLDANQSRFPGMKIHRKP